MSRLIRWMTLGCMVALTGCAGSPRISSQPETSQASTAPSTQLPDFLNFDGSQLQLQVRGRSCTLVWRGEFPADAVPLMREALSEVEKRPCLSRTLAMDLQGGDVGPATTVGAMLKNRQFNTELLAGSYCHTPCVMVFAAGRQRLMPGSGAPASLLLTQLRPDQDFGRATCASELSLGQQLILTRYLRAMLPLATATALYQKISQASCRSHDTLGAPEALALGLATGTGSPPLR